MCPTSRCSRWSWRLVLSLPPTLAPLARARHAGLGDSSQEEDVAHFSEHLLSARYGARCGARGFYVVCHLLLTPPMGLSVFLTCFTDEKTEAQGGEGTRQGRKAHGGRIQTRLFPRKPGLRPLSRKGLVVLRDMGEAHPEGLDTLPLLDSTLGMVLNGVPCADEKTTAQRGSVTPPRSRG